MSAFAAMEALSCQVRQGVLGLAVQGELVILRCLIRSLSAMQFDVAEQKGHKGLPTEHCIADLLVVSFHLSVQLLEETAGKVMRRFVIPSAVGALCRLVGLLEIAVQVGTLMVLICNRALGLFKR